MNLNYELSNIFNFRNGICLVIFSMPLYLWRFSIFGIPTNVLEIMIYLLFLIWIVSEIKKHRLSFPRRRESGIANIFINQYKILNLGIALLFVGAIISTIISSDIRTSLGIFKGWFVAPFLFFLVFINVIKEEKYISLSLKSWLASGVAVSLISIFYLLNNNLTFDGRLKAFFLSPNHLAMYLAPAFLLGLFFLLNKFRAGKSGARASARICPKWLNSIFGLKPSLQISNIQYSIVLIIILIPLYFTHSYGAFLGIFAAVVYLLAIGLKPSLRTFNIQYSIVLVIVFVSFIFITAVKFNQITNSNNRSSLHSRLMIWNASAEIIKDNPLFGIGPGTFQDAYLSYAGNFDEPYLEWAVPQPHNIFLAFYLQTGIIGFVGFVLILFWFFNCCRGGAKTCFYRQIANILMIYILIHGLVDTTYWKNDLSLMFWIVIGMRVVSGKISKSFLSSVKVKLSIIYKNEK